MVTRGDTKDFCDLLRSKTNIYHTRSQMVMDKYNRILKDAEKTYDPDERFESYENYISERIDSYDISEIRSFARDVHGYTQNVLQLICALSDNGIYILFEAKFDTEKYGDYFNNYDVMGYAHDETTASKWKAENPNNRAYKYCSMKEVSYDRK